LLRKGINVYNFDVFGVAETNVDWRLLGEQDRLYMRTKEWWETCHLNFTHNRVSPPLDKRQWGGSALFSLNQVAHRVVDKGWDPTNMGRWCWTKFRGRNNHCLRIFSAYCPNPPSGQGSVAALQRTVMLARQDFRDPRTAFIQDLDKEVSEVIKKGELVIIMLDGNSDMQNSPLATMLSNLKFREVILYRHGLGVSTFRRNNSATPIDGIWASAGISVIKGRYLDYDKVVPGADHKCLWIDISFQQAFGHNMPAINRPQTRRLHCKDPRIVTNYHRTYNRLAENSNLLSKVNDLMMKATYPLQRHLQQEYERLDQIRCQITAEAEKKCRKLRKGQVAFSPALQQAMRTTKVYTLLHRKAEGKKVSSRLLSRAIHKAKLTPVVNALSIAELKAQL
jgi:hypothetical protein